MMIYLPQRKYLSRRIFPSSQIQAGKAPLPGQVVYAGPIDCGRQLLKTGGISSLYRGLGATFIRGMWESVNSVIVTVPIAHYQCN